MSEKAIAMKNRISLLITLIFIVTSFSSYGQLSEKAKPIYQAALEVLQSDYAKQRFPPKTVNLNVEDNLPDTITVEDNRLFNFGKSMRSRQGKVEAKHIPVILKIINSDSEVSTAEKALLDAVKENKEITIYSTQASNKGYAVNLTFDTEPEAKRQLENFYEKGVTINSLQHMHLTFIDSKTIDNWLNYYYGNEQENELAIAFMQFKILSLSMQAYRDYKEISGRFESFIGSIQHKFYQRDENVHQEASRNLVLNMIKEFDEASYISISDFLYNNAMEK